MAEERTKKYAIEFKLYDGTTRSVSIEIPLGEDGGYYIPSIENKNGETLIYFTPSSPDMPAMEPIPVLNLNEAIDMALTQAKESGEFDGKDGYTPVKGVDYFDGKDGYTPVKGVDYFDGVDGKTPVKGKDYWTDTDKQEIVDDVLGQIDIPDVSVELPVFDLAALGMSAVMLPSGNASIATDTTSVISALNAGAVRFKIPTVMGTYTLDMHGLSDGSGAYQCVASAMLDMAIVVMVNVTSVGIQVVVEPLAAAIGFPSVTDDDNNKILQVVNGAWEKVAVKDSYVATFVDDYISSALEGDY